MPDVLWLAVHLDRLANPTPRPAGGEADLKLIFEFIDKKNLPNLGGVAFSAIGPLQVSEVKQKLGITD